ncbi:DUF7696 family protein [Paraburkholderia xenovorans]|uniref:DUF7696 family protein n=1 Tax=Paraburkholderia xenovorans TaxID=36873 RepID=UPI0038BBD0BB
MSTDIEQQRFDCEVRDIAKRTLDQRRMYLTEVERIRGKAVADRLRAALRALWDEKAKA